MTQQSPGLRLPVYAARGLEPANHNVGVTAISPETLSNDRFRYASQGDLSAEEVVLRTAVDIGDGKYKYLQELGVIDAAERQLGQRMSLYIVMPKVAPVSGDEETTPLVRHCFSEEWNGCNSATTKHRKSTIVGPGILSVMRPDQRDSTLPTPPEVGWHIDVELVVGRYFKQFSRALLSASQ